MLFLTPSLCTRGHTLRRPGPVQGNHLYLCAHGCVSRTQATRNNHTLITLSPGSMLLDWALCLWKHVAWPPLCLSDTYVDGHIPVQLNEAAKRKMCCEKGHTISFFPTALWLAWRSSYLRLPSLLSSAEPCLPATFHADLWSSEFPAGCHQSGCGGMGGTCNLLINIPVLP